MVLTAVVVCIILFTVGSYLAEASRRRIPRESQEIYFLFKNIKAETIDAGQYALGPGNEGYLDEWCESATMYIQEQGYGGHLRKISFIDGVSARFELLIRSHDVTLHEDFTVNA